LILDAAPFDGAGRSLLDLPAPPAHKEWARHRVHSLREITHGPRVRSISGSSCNEMSGLRSGDVRERCLRASVPVIRLPRPGLPGKSTRTSPPVVQGLRQMVCTDVCQPVQVRHGARHAEDSENSSRRESHPLGNVFQDTFAISVQPAPASDPRGTPMYLDPCRCAPGLKAHRESRENVPSIATARPAPSEHTRPEPSRPTTTPRPTVPPDPAYGPRAPPEGRGSPGGCRHVHRHQPGAWPHRAGTRTLAGDHPVPGVRSPARPGNLPGASPRLPVDHGSVPGVARSEDRCRFLHAGRPGVGPTDPLRASSGARRTMQGSGGAGWSVPRTPAPPCGHSRCPSLVPNPYLWRSPAGTRWCLHPPNQEALETGFPPFNGRASRWPGHAGRARSWWPHR